MVDFAVIKLEHAGEVVPENYRRTYTAGLTSQESVVGVSRS